MPASRAAGHPIVQCSCDSGIAQNRSIMHFSGAMPGGSFVRERYLGVGLGFLHSLRYRAYQDPLVGTIFVDDLIIGLGGEGDGWERNSDSPSVLHKTEKRGARGNSPPTSKFDGFYVGQRKKKSRWIRSAGIRCFFFYSPFCVP